MPTIDRRNLILLLLGVGAGGEVSEGLGGITRLQKLLFLLEQEEKLTPTANGFAFTAYKAGPYSSKVYDDLEFLENLGLVQSEVTAETTEPEAAEVDLLEFDQLMGPEDGLSHDDMPAADAYEERKYLITAKGREKIEQVLDSGTYQPVVDGIRKIKSKYGNHSLNDLLYYVYTKYPEMTVESEIKDKVLRRGK
jgi:uncharacterized protein YwgA